MVKGTAGIMGLAFGAAMMMGAANAAPGYVAGMMDTSHLNSSFEAWEQSGKHEFYVNCTSMDDYIVQSEGANMKAAQAAALQESVTKAGGNTCWPVWRGMVK